MTDPPHLDPAAPTEPGSGAPGWAHPKGQDSRTLTLAYYLEANRGTFTDEALAAKAEEAGYTAAEIQRAIQLLKSVEASKPVRRRARLMVLAAYLVTYALLVGGMILNPYTYGGNVIGIIVLTIVLAPALAIALALVRRSRARAETELALASVMAVPVIVLVVVAGLCVATGLPIPRTFNAGPIETAPTEFEPALPPAPAES